MKFRVFWAFLISLPIVFSFTTSEYHYTPGFEGSIVLDDDCLNQIGIVNVHWAYDDPTLGNTTLGFQNGVPVNPRLPQGGDADFLDYVSFDGVEGEVDQTAFRIRSTDPIANVCCNCVCYDIHVEMLLDAGTWWFVPVISGYLEGPGCGGGGSGQ